MRAHCGPSKLGALIFFQTIDLFFLGILSCSFYALFLLAWADIDAQMQPIGAASRTRCAFSHSAAQSASVSGSLTASSIHSHSLLHSVEDEAAVERRARNGFAPPSPVSSSQLLTEYV